MKKSFENYQRIAKSRMASLWVGEDHLVFVRGFGFFIPLGERYSRFRFGDIQYLAVTRTSRTLAISLYTFAVLGFFGIIAGIFSALGGSVPSFSTPEGIASWVGIGLLALMALFFLILLIRTLILGPTCKAELKTNIKRERLPVTRIKKAKALTETLAELIEKAQHDVRFR